MSAEEAPNTTTHDGEQDDSDEPVVPAGALRGIRDVRDGNTVDKEELASILDF